LLRPLVAFQNILRKQLMWGPLFYAPLGNVAKYWGNKPRCMILSCELAIKVMFHISFCFQK
jgi:hypothetical protein